MNRLTRNLAANYAGHGWSAIMGLAFVPLYIRYLGMEAYGLIGVYTILQAWLTLLDAGMTPTLNREMARYTAGARGPQSLRDLLRSLETICAGVAVLIAVGIWASSGYLAAHWLRPDRLATGTIAGAISLMGVVIALRLCESLYAGSLLGLQRQIRYNVALMVLATLRYGGAVAVLAWWSPAIESFFLWQAVVSLLAVGVLRASVYRLLPAAPGRFSPEALAGIGRFAGSMTGITFLGLLLTQADKILLSRLLPLESFAYYSLAATVASALYLIVVPVTQALYPQMVEGAARSDGPAMAALYHRGAQLITVITAPAALVLSAFAAGVIFTWTGDTVLAENTAPILSVLALGTFLHGLMYMPYHARLACGWTSLTLKVNLAAVLVLVPAILWLVPRHGAMAAAWVWFVLNCGYVLVPIHIMHRRILIGEKRRWYFCDVLLPAGGACAVVLAAALLRPSAYEDRLQWLAFLLACGALALLAGAMLARRVQPRPAISETRPAA